MGIVDLGAAVPYRIPTRVSGISAVRQRNILHRTQWIDAEENSITFIVVGIQQDEYIIVLAHTLCISTHLISDNVITT